jgi:hypothetical protein
MYASGTVTSLAPVIHSNEARSIYLGADASSAAYSFSDPCLLSMGAGQPQSFACSSDELTLPTAAFTRPDASLAGALDAAAAGGQGRHTY